MNIMKDMMNWDNTKAYTPGLVAALQDSKSGYLAARVLGRSRDKRGVAGLVKALDSEDKALRWDAARALRLITKQELGEEPGPWKAWFSKNSSRYPSP